MVACHHSSFLENGIHLQPALFLIFSNQQISKYFSSLPPRTDNRLESFRENQLEAINETLNGNDILVPMPTVWHRGIRYYHSDLGKADRIIVQNEWQSGKLQIVVATAAFDMGIDKPMYGL
nr:9740_t:CDS:2 [Entrophospora candida]